jgi:hypothetical protein
MWSAESFLIAIVTVGGVAWMFGSREDSSPLVNIITMVVGWIIGGLMIHSGIQKPAYATKPMWRLHIPSGKAVPRMPGADVEALAAEWDAACRRYPAVLADPWNMANGYAAWIEYLSRAHEKGSDEVLTTEEFVRLWLAQTGAPKP